MSHDTHQHNEGKKPVFGPGVIMGLSFWLFAFFFLSLCNGKKEHGAHEASEHGAAVENVKDENEAPKSGSTVLLGDSVEVEQFDSAGNSFIVKIPGDTLLFNEDGSPIEKAKVEPEAKKEDKK